MSQSNKYKRVMLSGSEASGLLSRLQTKDSSASPQNDSYGTVSPQGKEEGDGHSKRVARRQPFFPRVPLALPYWNGDTHREIVRAIASGSVIDGAALEKLRSLISRTLKGDHVLLCGSGSLALELALQTFKLRKGDEVIIPAFCCSSVVPPILAAGGTPVLADIGDELSLTVETVSDALTRKTKAIIVPHLFGNPADILPIIDLARSKNIRVVDDAAQALGATIDGQPIGSFGDAGILSFGREKVCFGIGGGALVCQEEAAADGALPRPNSLRPLRELLSVLIGYGWRRWSAPLAKILASSVDPSAAPRRYRRESMANLSAAVAATLVETLEENIAARRERVRAYQNVLGGVARLKLVSHRAGSACLTQVVQILPANRNRDVPTELITALGAQGYEVRGSYVPLHLVPGWSACVWDRLPHADHVWPDLVELPCEPNLAFDDLARIATIVTEVVNV